MDGHDEPDRAAGRLRSRGGAHARRSARRRHLQALRAEDLHHVRRARFHREHHSPRACAHADGARKASRAFRCSSFRSSSSTPMARSARATTCIACRSSTSSAFTRARRPCWRTATTGGATGYLIGEENRGLEYMFIMMNQARFSVGMEGVGHVRACVPARGRIRARSRAGQGGRALRRRPRRARSSIIRTSGGC